MERCRVVVGWIWRVLNVTVEVCGLGFKLGGARVVWDLGTKSYEAGVLNLYHYDINDNAVPYNSKYSVYQTCSGGEESDDGAIVCLTSHVSYMINEANAIVDSSVDVVL